jgi:hypothetical protein
MKPDYDAREIEMKQMSEWMKRQQLVNPKLDIWYEDKQLRIYHIHQPVNEKERLEQIWGK